MNKASVRSKKKLEGVDSRLVLLVGYALAISPVDFFVNEGGKMLGLKLNFGYDWGWDNPHIELR